MEIFTLFVSTDSRLSKWLLQKYCLYITAFYKNLVYNLTKLINFWFYIITSTTTTTTTNTTAAAANATAAADTGDQNWYYFNKPVYYFCITLFLPQQFCVSGILVRFPLVEEQRRRPR